MVTHALRVINDEARADYDAGPAPVRLRQRFTMISEEEYTQAASVGATALSIYLCLARHANQDAACWPSYQSIADELGLSRRVVIQWIKRLEAAGVLAIEQRRLETGADSSNIFRLRLRPGNDPIPQGVQNRNPVSALVQNRNPPGAESAPKLNTVNKTQGERPPSPQKGQSQKNDVLTVKQTELFQRWYSGYPNKVARGDAEKAWLKISPSEEQVDEMVAALEWQIPANNWTPTNRKYIPHPATYLNRKQWTDDPVAPVVDPVRVPDKVAFRQAQIKRAIDIAEGRA
jgi:hypothetical protein